MSVIFSQRTPGRRWLSLWPLALFLLLMLVGGLWMWQAWPQVMLKSALWQRDVNQQLSALLNAVATHPERAGGSLLLLSFMYGVLHALGPGHGKVVIATWLATHPSKLKSSIVLTLAAALLQGLEKGSYALVGGLGILLCWRAIKRLRALLRKPVFIAFTPRHVHHEKCGCGHTHLPIHDRTVYGDAALFRRDNGAVIQ